MSGESPYDMASIKVVEVGKNQVLNFVVFLYRVVQTKPGMPGIGSKMRNICWLTSRSLKKVNTASTYSPENLGISK